MIASRDPCWPSREEATLPRGLAVQDPDGYLLSHSGSQLKDIAQERNFHAHIVCERQFDAWLEDPVGPSGAVNFITTNEEYVRACLSESGFIRDGWVYRRSKTAGAKPPHIRTPNIRTPLRPNPISFDTKTILNIQKAALAIEYRLDPSSRTRAVTQPILMPSMSKAHVPVMRSRRPGLSYEDTVFAEVVPVV